MITNKQRMLMAMRGENPDVIPFAPRLDLWFNANKAAGTLPERYRSVNHYFEIARSEGWALHQINPAYQEIRKPEDNLHWALGLLTYKETVYGFRFKGFQKGMLSAMEVIGERFRDGTAFIPEVLLSARAMHEATSILEPYLSEKDTIAKEKILIGTVSGDLHDIGKNIVSTILRGVGYEIKDIGINVGAKEFVLHVEEYKPDILALSALLTTTMPQMKLIIKNLSESGLREKIKVIVGGAPLNQKFADDIGADGYAADAGSAVSLVQKLLAD